MARAQTWTRNISKKVKKVKSSIVNDEPLNKWKRMAEDSGLIIHARQAKESSARKKGSKK